MLEGIEPLATASGRISHILEKDDAAGFASSAVWPLFHGMAEDCEFDPDSWKSYLERNRRQALDVARQEGVAKRVWVHDYQLMHAGHFLRSVMPDLDRLGLTLQLPFPALDTLRRLPRASQLVNALLAYDVIAFQTARDLHNFAHSVQFFAPDAGVRATEADGTLVRVGQRQLRAVVLPRGVDFEALSTRAHERDVLERMHVLQKHLGPCAVLFGIDPLDSTRGLLHRLRAFERALELRPSLRQNVALYQVVTPARQEDAQSRRLKGEIEEAVGRISGRFSTPSWSPVHYHYKRVSDLELRTMYRVATVMLVTPLRDGTTMAAKEFVASRIDHAGVLVLSEFAGAAQQLAGGALLVNPYDIDQSAETIARALELPVAKRVQRMRAMRWTTRRNDVHWWAGEFRQLLEDPDDRLPAPAIAADPWRETMPLA